jgi:hypothetical protein
MTALSRVQERKHIYLPPRESWALCDSTPRTSHWWLSGAKTPTQSASTEALSPPAPTGSLAHSRMQQSFIEHVLCALHCIEAGVPTPPGNMGKHTIENFLSKNVQRTLGMFRSSTVQVFGKVLPRRSP